MAKRDARVVWSSSDGDLRTDAQAAGDPLWAVWATARR